MSEPLEKRQIIEVATRKKRTQKPKTPQKKRISVLLPYQLVGLFEQYQQAHYGRSDSAIATHLIHLGFIALENNLEVDWHKPPHSKVEKREQAD